MGAVIVIGTGLYMHICINSDNEVVNILLSVKLTFNSNNLVSAAQISLSMELLSQQINKHFSIVHQLLIDTDECTQQISNSQIKKSL